MKRKKEYYMLSKKVTYAIIALNELHSYLSDVKRCKQMKVRRLASLCGIASDDLLPTLSLLHHFRYIELKNDTIALICHIDEITLYDLVITLHDGMPIGEETEHDYHGLDYYANPKYPKIVHLEEDIRDVACRYLGYVTIASLGNHKIKSTI